MKDPSHAAMDPGPRIPLWIERVTIREQYSLPMVSDAGRRNVLAAAVLGTSLAPFMVSALVVALPTIADEFSADASTLGWVTSAFFISAAVFLVPLGRIADLHGMKKVFLAGLGVYLASSNLCPSPCSSSASPSGACTSPRGSLPHSLAPCG
jgi:MFS family permease